MTSSMGDAIAGGIKYNEGKEKEQRELVEGRPDFDGRDASWTKDDKSVETYWQKDVPLKDPDYKPLPNGGEHAPFNLDLPPIPGGMNNPKTEGQVISVEALKDFGKYLTKLVPALEKAIEEVSKVDIRSGAFGAAWNLNNEVNGLNKFRDNTLAVLRAVLNAILYIKECVDAIAERYKNQEELSKADSAELARLMNQAKSSIDSLKLI